MRLLYLLLFFSSFVHSQELFVRLDVPVGVSDLPTAQITSEQICFHDDANFTITPDNTDFSTPVTSFQLDIPSEGTYSFTALPCQGAAFAYGIVELVAGDGTAPLPIPDPTPSPVPDQNDERRIHFFGHSLIFEEDRNVPHWMNRLSFLGNRTFSANGQYGFVPRVPASDDLGWPNVPVAWTDDFSVVTDAVMTVLNFALDFPPDQAGYLDEAPSQSVINAITWAKNQNPDIRIWIYESWADGGYISQAEPMSEEELVQYHAFNLTTNAQWYDLLMEDIREVHPDVNFIPVSRIISGLAVDMFSFSPTDLYVDSAPHGTPTTYFIAALVTYMSMYDDFVERVGEGEVNNQLITRYPELIYYIKDNL